MRISGIASGFDTEEMVKQLMQVERLKVDRVEQNKQTILWRQEQYNSMNKQFANFILNTQKDIGIKKTSSTGSLFDSSYMNSDYVKKATSSNEMAATVTSTGRGVNGNFEIEVDTLAKDSTYTSAEISNDILAGSKYLSFKINDKTITVGDGTKSISMDDVVTAINNAGSENPSLATTAFFDSGTNRLFIQSTNPTKIKLEGVGNSTGDALVTALNIEGANGMVSLEGNQSKIIFNGVELQYDSNNINLNGLDIELKAKGTTRISVSTNTQGIMEKIEKLVADYNDLVDVASGLVGEKRYASYKPLSSEEKKAMTEEDVKLWEEKAKSGLLNRDETLQRTLQTIRTNLYEKVEGNASFEYITQLGITTQEYSRGSAGGKLQIDTEKLKEAIEKDAEGVMDFLFKEPKAISKDGYGLTKPGETATDEEIKLYESELSRYNKDNKIHRNKYGGVFNRVYDDLIDGMKAIIDKSGPGKDAALYRGVKSNMLLDFVTTKSSISDLDKSINEMNRRIDNLNILLAKKEDSHYAKFTAMEKQMYKMQNQSSWIAQQFM